MASQTLTAGQGAAASQTATATHPVDIIVPMPEQSSRSLALLAILFWLKSLMMLPHWVILWFLWVAQAVAIVIGFWGVLFTGRYPKGPFEFGVGVQRWYTRAIAWQFGWTDKYPPFSLKK